MKFGGFLVLLTSKIVEPAKIANGQIEQSISVAWNTSNDRPASVVSSEKMHN